MCVCVCVCVSGVTFFFLRLTLTLSPLSPSLFSSPSSPLSPPLSPLILLPPLFLFSSLSPLHPPPLPLLPRRCRHKPELAKKLYLMALKVRPNDPMVRRNYALLLRDCPELRSGHSRIISVPVRKQRTGSRRPPPRGPPGGGGSGSPSSSKTFGSLGR